MGQDELEMMQVLVSGAIIDACDTLSVSTLPSFYSTGMPSPAESMIITQSTTFKYHYVHSRQFFATS